MEEHEHLPSQKKRLGKIMTVIFVVGMLTVILFSFTSCHMSALETKILEDVVEDVARDVVA